MDVTPHPDTSPHPTAPLPPAAARSRASTTGETRWLRRLRAVGAPTARLILFPHAGGGSTFFRDWPAVLPDDVEAWAVQYPGRERRVADPLPRTLSDVAAGVAAEIRPLLDRPTAFFGHSMGATVAYEVLRLLERDGPSAFDRLRHFFVSARQAPHRPRSGLVHTLPEDEFAAVLRRHGGTDDALLDDPEMRELFLPVIRNDYRIAETHRPTPVTPAMPVDITVLTGDDDPSVDPAAAAGWADAGRGDFLHVRLAGGHFYLVPRLAEVAEAVTRRLRGSLRVT